jgi:hypothetical protein
MQVTVPKTMNFYDVARGRKEMTTTTLTRGVKSAFFSDRRGTGLMRALVFHGPDNIAVERVPIPRAGYGEVVMRLTLTTICGTDVHILKGEYPVRPGLVIGHEAVGVIHEIGPGVTGYQVGERVLVGAITLCGQCNACLGGDRSQCGGPTGGWKFGNTINGAQAEYLLVPSAQAPASSRCRWSHSRRVWATSRLSPRFAPVAKNACVD